MMKNKYLWLSSIAVAVLVLDQVTKYLVMQHIPRIGSVRVIPGFFDLINVRNRGAAFGILSGDHGGWRIALFVIISIAALAVIALLVRSVRDRMTLVSFSLIAGGAIGNLVDRIRFGEVVDFIDWYYRSWHWPTFNIADSAITVGVLLLVVDMLFTSKQEARET